jgi:hypothetical protein
MKFYQNLFGKMSLTHVQSHGYERSNSSHILLQNVPDVDCDVELKQEKLLLTDTMLKLITQMSNRLPSNCITMKGVHIY